MPGGRSSGSLAPSGGRAAAVVAAVALAGVDAAALASVAGAGPVWITKRTHTSKLMIRRPVDDLEERCICYLRCHTAVQHFRQPSATDTACLRWMRMRG